MKSLTYFIIGIFLLIQSSLIRYLFSEKYPCNLSCIGCSSFIELLHDTWTTYYSMIMVIISMYCFYKGVLNIEGKKK